MKEERRERKRVRNGEKKRKREGKKPKKEQGRVRGRGKSLE